MKESQLLKGVLEGCVLEIISKKAIYGYELIQSLKEMGFDKIVAGTIYPLLQKLEKQGIIHGEMRPSPDGPDRKYFSLSDAGKERLGEFWDQWQELVTKVERIKKEKPLSSFTSFSGDAKVKGDKPGSIILACRKMEASVKVADRLQIEPGESITYLKRLRLLNGKIIALHESHISSRIGIEICEDDFDTTTSLYEYLEENGISLGSADETLEVKMASFELRRDLFLEETQPLVYKERVTYDSEGHPVEFSQNSYIAETYKYYVHIVNVKDGGNRS